MSTPTWVTVVAYDTPFLAQLATERLEDEGIGSRLLSDSGGETLPHISFATGGHRVQVAPEDEAAARAVLAALDDLELDGVDVGEFTDEDGVQPPDLDEARRERGGGDRSPLLVLGAITVIVATVIVVFAVLAAVD